MSYYDSEYTSSIVTDIPSSEDFENLKKRNFSNSAYFQSWYHFWVRKVVNPPARIFNFGSSWGYFDYQLKTKGYFVEGFEISKKRAEIGRKKLGLTIHTNWEAALKGNVATFDLVYSGHVLEHVYDLNEALTNLSLLAREGGILLILVPNAGGLENRQHGINSVGRDHSIGFTGTWLKENLPSHGWENIEIFSSLPGGKILANSEGDTLYCIAKRFAVAAPPIFSEEDEKKSA